MRKAFTLVLGVALVIGLTANVASAINPPYGELEFKLTDRSSLYEDGVPLPAGTFPQGGEEGRAIAWITSVFAEDASSAFWAAGSIFSGEELTIVEYDFITVEGPDVDHTDSIDGVQGYYWDGTTYVANSITGSLLADGTSADGLYFIPDPDGDKAGVIEIYLDTTPDIDGSYGYWNDVDGDGVYIPANGDYPVGSAPNQGPNRWDDSTDGTANESYEYPGLTDVGADNVTVDPAVSLWLSGTYVPVFSDDGNNYRDVGEMDLMIFDMDGGGIDYDIDGSGAIGDGPGEQQGSNDVSAVYFIAEYDAVGTGTINAWLDITGGTYYATGNVGDDHYDLSGYAAEYDVVLEGILSAGEHGWAINSQDPALMFALPEPTSITLLSLGLLGIAARLRRKK